MPALLAKTDIRVRVPLASIFSLMRHVLCSILSIWSVHIPTRSNTRESISPYKATTAVIHCVKHGCICQRGVKQPTTKISTDCN